MKLTGLPAVGNAAQGEGEQQRETRVNAKNHRTRDEHMDRQQREHCATAKDGVKVHNRLLRSRLVGHEEKRTEVRDHGRMGIANTDL